MEKRLILILIGILVLMLPISFFIYYGSFSSISDFTTDKILIKSIIKEGEGLNSTLTIESLSENSFTIEVTDLKNLILLSEENFRLDSNEKKEIVITFIGENSKPGVYAGSLKIKSQDDEEIIPVILEVTSIDPYFALNMDVDSRHKEIKKGDNFVAGINFFNLKNTETLSADVEYKIINLNGESIFQENENVAIGSKSTITKTIQIADGIKEGNYVFATILNFQNSTSTASYFFTVSNKFSASDFLNTNIFIAAILVILFIIVGIIIYILSERDKLVSRLKGQQKSELKFYANRIEKQKESLLKSAKSKREKEKINRDYSDARNKVLKEIKREQKNQRIELKKLSGKKRDVEVEKRIKKWREQTYAKAVAKAQIKQEIKAKLGTLKRAYSEGYISKDSYKKVEKRLSKKAG